VIGEASITLGLQGHLVFLGLFCGALAFLLWTLRFPD
jgi:hypothetical protein